MYGSELIFHFEHQDGDVHKVISPRSNWYDYEMGMARIDYKPLDLEHDHHGLLEALQGLVTAMLAQVDDVATG